MQVPTCACSPGTLSGPATWAEAKEVLPACTIPGQGEASYAVRCGGYDGLVTAGVDSAEIHFYDATGVQVGIDFTGQSTLHCTSSDANFVSPVVDRALVGCERVQVPTCADAGVGACASGPMSGPSTWAEAKQFLPACTIPGQREAWYAVRCGGYDGLVSGALDSADIHFYDATGLLVGIDFIGQSTLHCISDTPGFVSPVVNWALVGCDRVQAPTCSADGGVLDGG